jgi:hypothetical protein
LPNELFYETFVYLDFHHVYDGFFNLNKRFQHLFLRSTLPIKINISSISKSNFERYHKNIIIPNKHRINVLRLSNPFTVDIVLSPPGLIRNFFCLETLILDNINTKNLYKICLELMCLPNLHSLVLNPAQYVENSTDIFTKIFCLSKLKYYCYSDTSVHLYSSFSFFVFFVVYPDIYMYTLVFYLHFE